MLKRCEARKGDAKTSTTQTSMDSARKPNKWKNYKTQHRLSGQAPRSSLASSDPGPPWLAVTPDLPD